MIIFTALAPRHSSDNVDGSDRTLFLSDRFSWSAFWLGPLWLGYTRNWFGLLIWLLGMSLLMIVQNLLKIDFAIVVFAILGLAFFLGLEGHRLHEQSLLRRDYKILGIISANALSEAEEIYFKSKVFASRNEDEYINNSMFYNSNSSMFPMLETGR